MSTRQAEAARALKALHAGPEGFLIPNAWDEGSAILLAAAGFPAIATTSAGVAFSLGRQDFAVSEERLGVSLDEMLARCAAIAAVVRVPVSADLEAGYGDAPEAVAATIARAIEAGLAGGNIEDKVTGRTVLYDEALSAARIAAARAELKRRGNDFVLNARTDALLVPGGGGMEAAIRRANTYLAAGADCVFVPGAADGEAVKTLADAIKGPLNVVIGLAPGLSDGHAALAAGARRVSVGGTIARASFGLVRRAAAELKATGTIRFAEGQMSGSELNAAMAEGRAP